MFRTVVVRSTRSLAQRSAYRLVSSKIPLGQVRFETTSIPPKSPLSQAHQRLKEAREKNDDLQRDWDAKELLYAELKPRTENPTPNTFLIDVREPDEVIQGMIPSAVNLPLSVLGNSLHLHHVAFKEKHGFEKPTKDQELIFYCRSGKRSASASDIAKRNGYKNILNYKGSWLEWVEKENKVT
ncbi:endoplasmic reticulum protein [Collybia nuda]|uniref:Endoplasmic reticulum protein n=1 Tax=Collybia nuda TaxID=64659 RepID=A0A9P5XSG5_9AGAR|nr:endoplasmic reticulum protein [Collybia nuda]